MTTAPVQTAGRQRWVCDDCGGAFVWDEQSYWFGSWRACDDGDWAAMDVYCGTCRDPRHLGPLAQPTAEAPASEAEER